jgi:hypothetical protein
MSTETNTTSYFDRRMSQLGITPEINQVELYKFIGLEEGTQLTPVPIFRPHEKGIEIIAYKLNRRQPDYTPENSRWKKHWSIIRHEKPMTNKNGDLMKYQMPKGAGSYPFFPPNLLKKYDAKTPSTFFTSPKDISKPSKAICMASISSAFLPSPT